MCGIAGFLSNERIAGEFVLSTMISQLNHRGPDSQGLWFDSEKMIGLAHARLSIIDLTVTGHQPMISKSERYVMVFNGEIYNHLDLRKALDVDTIVDWKGTSDTETLLAAFEYWGIESSLKKCIGMFAIALWDQHSQKLTLVRDRMGEKPLYYGWVNSNFIFASELSAIKKFEGFNNTIDKKSVALYMSYGSIPEPFSIYEKINKLESGSLLTLDFSNKELDIKKYWSVESCIKASSSDMFSGSKEAAIATLDELLNNAVKLQMISDVPIGAFLSGGVDSSVIVALMQANSTRKIDTFSIGFDKKEYNEAIYAKQVANHLGTNHHETYVTDKEALDIVPQLAKIYSEPFSESSQIPTFLVSKIAKKKVTVSLSGDAGDELFGGYSRYKLAHNTWGKLARTPLLLRKGAFELINFLPYEFWYTLLSPLNGKKNNIGLPINYTDKLFKALPLFNINNSKEFYHKGLMNHNLDLNNWLPNTQKPLTKFESNPFDFDDFFQNMMLTDLVTYLPNNNLVKVDRAAMANSLETRVPLLDFRVVEFALALPTKFKICEGTDKWVLRQVLYQYVPKQLIERPKMGFAVPLSDWLRGPLKEWAESLLDYKKLEEDGFFNPEFIHKKWLEHQSGKRNWQNQLWDVIVFQSWLDEQKNGK